MIEVWNRIDSNPAFWPIVITLLAIGAFSLSLFIFMSRTRRADARGRETASAAYRDAKSHKELLAALINYMETEEMPFYESNQQFSWTMWHLLSGLALLSSLLTTLAAALSDQAWFGGNGKVALLVLSLVTTGATAFLQLFKFREKEALREDGRIELEDIILNAYDRMIVKQTPEEERKSFHEVRARFMALEIAQHRQDVLLRQEAAKDKDATDENGKPTGARST